MAKKDNTAQSAPTRAKGFKVRTDPNNYRLHPDRNKALIKRSLEENGAGRSIVVDNTGASIGGSGVLEQAEKLGIKQRIVETDGSELVVVVRKDIGPDDPRRKMLALADNATTDQSEWDVAQLEADFSQEELREWAVELPKVDDPDDNGGKDGADIGAEAAFIVEVTCDSEDEQRRIYEQLTDEGLTCRLLTL